MIHLVFVIAAKTSSEGVPRSGFATNFGQNVRGAGIKGTEGQFIANIFKPLVTRLVEFGKELHSHENIVSIVVL